LSQIAKRIAALEGGVIGATRRAYVWVRPGQTDADAIAERRLPPDVEPVLFRWKSCGQAEAKEQVANFAT
jgi:hypothetical protein